MDYNQVDVEYVKALLLLLNNKGISIDFVNEKLVLEGPIHKLDEDTRSKIQAYKQDIINFVIELKFRHRASDAIPKRNTENIPPLSFTQQRLWVVDKLNEGSIEYNMPMAFHISGVFDVDVAERTLEQIVNRHEVLRTVYHEKEGSPFQHILPPQTVKIARHNLTSVEADEQLAAMWNIITQDSQLSFNLQRDLMIRANFILLTEPDVDKELSAILAFNIHHIASDGWSMEVFSKEFIILYQACLDGKPVELEPLQVQYADFACWQRQTFQAQRLDSELRYWESQLKDAPLLHSLNLDKARPAIKQYEGQQLVKHLPACVADALRALVRRYELTPFMLLHGALALVLARHGHSSDIVIGTPVANRMKPELAPLIGCFVNTLALRVNTEHTSLVDYFTHVRDVNLAAQSNQNIPFEQVVDHLNVPRSTAYSPLIQIILDTNNSYGMTEQSQLKDTRGGGTAIVPLNADIITTKFDLDLELIMNDNGVTSRWKYDVALFDEGTISRLNQHVCNILEALSKLDSLDVPVTSLSMLSSFEEQQLFEMLNGVDKEYPRTTCIHEIIEKQTIAFGKEPAVIFSDQQLSYDELNKRANRVAHFIKTEHHVTPDTLIGLCVERSLDMVVGMLAILKAGGAYVPLDPNYPQSRLQQIMNDANLSVVLTQQALVEKIEFGSRKTVSLDAQSLFLGCSELNIPVQSIGLTASNLAYVIYTSGSTGTPKGVMLEHQSVMNYLSHVCNDYMEASISSAVVSTSLNFDATVTSLFGPLLIGKSVELLPDDQGLIPCLYERVMNSSAPLLFKLTPLHVSALLDMMDSKEKSEVAHVFVVGGEALLPETIQQLRQRLLSNVTVINEYGPTETTVGSTQFRVTTEPTGKKSVSIGKSIQNTQIRILDREANLVPIGAIGEVHIGGDGLARGYLNNSQLTADKFITWRYTALDGSITDQRLYKTGDLARVLPDGNLEFIGRKDDQVKVRGYRIELGDIEHHLCAAPNVESGVVLLNKLGEDNKSLSAYVKLSSVREGALELDGTDPYLRDIWSYLESNVPSFMIPSNLIVVADWPITPNGKIDKSALLSLNNSLVVDKQCERPQSPTEIQLAQIWAELLNVDMNTIAADQNLLKLGGDSLLIIRMMVQIKQQFDIKPELQQVYDILTIKQLAAYLDQLINIKDKEKTIAEETVEQEGWF